MAEIRIIPESIELIKMSDEAYFSDAYKDYISNSRLGLIDPNNGGSIEKFESGFKGDYSASYELGSAVHCMLLQKGEFFISDLCKPNGKLGEFLNSLSLIRKTGEKLEESIKEASVKANYYAANFSKTRLKNAVEKGLSFYLKRYKEKEEEGKIYLSENSLEKYTGCINSVENNNEIVQALSPEELFTPVEVFNEYAVLCTLEVTDDEGNIVYLKFKGKFDNFTINHDSKEITLNDLKTTGRSINYFMNNGSFEKYNYGRQIGVYSWLLQMALTVLRPELTGYTYKAAIAAVETFPNYQSTYFRITNKDIKKGLREAKTLILYVAKWKLIT
ncbi:MAG: hypothetical protein PF569_02465 [Candidatus Woesearchaeota archaeon]|jgi:hypothetical protein|nr:hypothetical protein [Candidatus Woesearchaeota archaeon]